MFFFYHFTLLCCVRGSHLLERIYSRRVGSERQCKLQQVHLKITQELTSFFNDQVIV